MSCISSWTLGVSVLRSLTLLVFLAAISLPATSLRILNPNDIKFFIFTNKSNTDQYNEIIHGKEQTITACGYDPSKPLVLLVHGVLSNSKTVGDVQAIKNVYLETELPGNIVMVDYGILTRSRLPPLLSKLSILSTIGLSLRINLIATRIANFTQFLINAKALPGPQEVHIIGVSVGAHISGAVGRQIKNRIGTPVARITGLDPSVQLPLPNFNLVQSDASFVDCSYTSFAKYGNFARRIGLRCGRVQFYLNGGDRQPNCPNISPFINPYCSHSTAAYYFAKSVKFKDIKACKCIGNCRGNKLQRWLGLRLTQDPLICLDKTIYGQCVPPTASGDYYVSIS